MVVDPAEALKQRPTKLLVLLKVGRKEHLEQLRQGKIWCRHLTYYRQGEGAAPQPWQDPDEGVAAVFQSDRIRIVLRTQDGAEHVVDAETGLVDQVKVSRDLRLPAFCLHAVHTGEWTDRQFDASATTEFMKHLEVPEGMSGFGDHVLVLGPEFVDRLLTACRQQKISIYRGFVKYLDESEVHGKIPAQLVGFVKLNRFASEREYRFVFEAAKPLPDPFVLDIGPLEDVAMLMTLEDFKKNVRIQFDDEDAAGGA